MIQLQADEMFWLVETSDHESVWFEWIVKSGDNFKKTSGTYASRDDAVAEASMALVRLRRLS